MRRLQFILVLILFFLCSCKSIKNLTAKDNSVQPAAKQPVNQGGPVFIENISVNPASNKKVMIDGDKVVKAPVYDIAVPHAAIEDASELQFKYAVLLDVPVENVQNLPLYNIIDYWWGTRYCMGGSSENCIDCSAFTQALYREVYHALLPRTAKEQYGSAEKIGMNDMQEGDLVFFHTSRRGISHVGVYLTNNKFAHASVSNGVVISDLGDPYWKSRYRGAGRVRK
mgnify:CR=1 FL=1